MTQIGGEEERQEGAKNAEEGSLAKSGSARQTLSQGAIGRFLYSKDTKDAYTASDLSPIELIRFLRRHPASVHLPSAVRDARVTMHQPNVPVFPDHPEVGVARHGMENSPGCLFSDCRGSSSWYLPSDTEPHHIGETTSITFVSNCRQRFSPAFHY